MFISLIIVCALPGLIAVGSGFGKLTGQPQVIETMRSVGVEGAPVRILAVLELLGAAGLLIGIWIPAIGVSASAALAL